MKQTDINIWGNANDAKHANFRKNLFFVNDRKSGYLSVGILMAFLFLCLVSCSKPMTDYSSVERFATIFPAYKGTVIPPNIAPLNFEIRETGKQFRVRISVSGRDSFEFSSNKTVNIPIRKWKTLLEHNRGNPLVISVFAKSSTGWSKYQEIRFLIAEEAIDPYIAYRLIEPGYTIWNRMGLFQRNLENFDETPFMLNTLTDNNCMNCHSFCGNDPETMLFHLRKRHAGTIVVKDGKAEKINLKTPDMPSAAVYPRWHPEGRYIAFSTNVTQQGFHTTNPNKIEVFDKESDIIIYDTQTNTIFTDSLIHSSERFETFPEWSPDGKYLYFCSATARPMPQEYDSVRYDLLRIPFDMHTAGFGTEVDTLVSSAQTGKSATLPRVSPDGKHLVCCLSDFGTFPIWHRETDLYMLDLDTKQIQSMENVNSNEADSYHSWSSNGRWIIFSSRRLDGRYTRLFISYFDADGKFHPPFLLPQKSPLLNDESLLSYNIPEFMTGKIKISPTEFRKIARGEAKEVPIISSPKTRQP